MLRHCVLFSWNGDVAEDHKRKVFAALAALPAQIPEILAYSVGPDLGIREGNYDFGLVADFADEAGFQAYAGHPQHLAVIAELIQPYVASRVSVQFEV